MYIYYKILYICVICIYVQKIWKFQVPESFWGHETLTILDFQTGAA